MIKAIAHSGATDTMSNFGREVYISYRRLKNSYVVLANQKAKCLGVGHLLSAPFYFLFVNIDGLPVVLSFPIMRALSYFFRM